MNDEIEQWDRVRSDEDQFEGVVTEIEDGTARVQIPGRSVYFRPVSCLRLVAKASYTDVKPAEHPAVTELRSAWLEWQGKTLEAAAAAALWTPRRTALAVLAVIDLIPPEPERDDRNWALAAEAEVTRLRAVLDDAKAAEAASSRLVEAMEKLADEFAEHGDSDVFTVNAYRGASRRIRAAVKAATETGGCNG